MKRRALVSVSDKRGIEDFARRLGTWVRDHLDRRHRQGALRCQDRSRPRLRGDGCPRDTRWPVKTLHPKIHGGILADLEDPDHGNSSSAGHRPIDLVCINLYPLEETSPAAPPKRRPSST